MGPPPLARRRLPGVGSVSDGGKLKQVASRPTPGLGSRGPSALCSQVTSSTNSASRSRTGTASNRASTPSAGRPGGGNSEARAWPSRASPGEPRPRPPTAPRVGAGGAAGGPGSREASRRRAPWARRGRGCARTTEGAALSEEPAGASLSLSPFARRPQASWGECWGAMLSCTMTGPGAFFPALSGGLVFPGEVHQEWQ